MEGYYSMAEFAAKEGMSVSAANRLCARGTLAFVWVAGRRLIPAKSYQRWLADKEAQNRRRSRAEQGNLDL